MNLKKSWLPGIAAGIIVLTGVSSASAQQRPEQSRQDRIREHQERIKKILEESNRRRAEQQQQQGQQPPAAPGSPAATPAAGQATPAAGASAAGQAAPPAAARPGQALPTGPVAKMTPPVTQATPTPAAQAPQTARSESRTILMFQPMDSIVAVGDRFKTDVVAETKEGEIDEISFLLKYPRNVLNPLALDHAALDPYVKDSIEYEFNPDDGTIYLHTKLKEPTRFGQKGLVSIVWEAIESTDGAVISYEFGKNQTTGLYLKGSNLLGTMPGSDDGVIKTTVQVIGPRTKPTIRKLSDGLLIGARPRTTVDDSPEEFVQLNLRSSVRSVQPGEVFKVDVMLNNPGEERIDRLRLYLQFDPASMEVVDYDAGNVVTRGTNIHDEPAREKFPFDYYRYNYADNEQGIIVYEVSASNSQVRGSGKIATIKLRALTDSPRAELVLVKNADGLTPTTDVTFLGESKLRTAPAEQAKALNGLAIPISGKAVADTDSNASDVYNPFISNLARRMRTQSD